MNRQRRILSHKKIIKIKQNYQIIPEYPETAVSNKPHNQTQGNKRKKERRKETKKKMGFH